MKKLFLVLIVFLIGFTVYSQEIKVTGKVTDENAEPIPGVNVMIKGTVVGSITSIDGIYELNASADDSLLVSFVGYITKTIPVNGRSQIDISMEIETLEMDQVMVTALGIKRENKSLGYDIEQQDGEYLMEARESNLVNSLSGKVAGVNITKGANGPGASSRIVIRGETSLTGTNQPLFVVDGIPIRNETDNRSNSGIADNMNIDFGNGAADLNPEDIESITILKSGAAAALYGSRGGNGVVLITTKSGKGKKGFEVSFTTTNTWETILAAPKYQTEFGQGKNGQFSFLDGSNGGLYDGVDESWGPQLNHIVTAADLDANGMMSGIPQTVGELFVTRQHDSPGSNGLRAGDVHATDGSGLYPSRVGTVTPTPFMSHGSVIDQFFVTGFSTTNSVSINGSDANGSFRVSLTNFMNKDITPNMGMNKNTISVSANRKIGSKLNVDISASYINSYSDNRPVNGYGTESLMYLWTWWGQQIDVNSLKEYWQRGNEGVQQFNYNYNYHDNPYFNVYENTNGLDKNRLIGNVSFNYQFTPALSLMVRSGIDYYNELRTWKRAFSTMRFPNGQYREDNIIWREINSDFLLSYSKAFSSKWQTSISAGGNLMNSKDHYGALSANKLIKPDLYNFSNSAVSLVSDYSYAEREIRSLYAMANISYNDYLFLDLSARNDWSSTLPDDNNSYFYPSVSLSSIVSEMVKLPELISYFKVRASLAQVGSGGTTPYTGLDVYNMGNPWGTYSTATESGTMANKDLKPEMTTSWEIGTDIKVFNNRLGANVTYYSGLTKNQIIPIQISPTSGYTQKWINAGEISSKGWEVTLNGHLLKLANGINWFSTITYSTNKSVLEKLYEGIDSYTITSNRVTIIAKEGERMGAMYGTGLLKNEEDGRLIYRSGLPVQDNELRYLGNYNPDFRMGFHNEFAFKGLSLSFLFDWSKGGTLFSSTRLIAATSGNIYETLWGRSPDYKGPYYGIKEGGISWEDGGVNYTDGIIGDGWKEVYDNEGNVTGYVENDVIVHASAYHNKRYKRENEEEGIYDGSYVKLREVKLSYVIPSKLLTKLPFKSVKVSLVGRNLLLWAQFPHGDPETFGLSGQYLIPGVEDYSMPSTRSMGFSVNLIF